MALQKASRLLCVDNSGARVVQIIGHYGQHGGTASIGDVVKVAIKEARGDKVSAGTMKKAVVLETKYPTQRKNGSSFQYMRNTCALLSEKGTPVGNRVRSMLSYEFLKPRWKRLSALGKRIF